MANRRTRQHQQPLMEQLVDSYSEEDEEDVEMEVQTRRPGRPRRTSSATSPFAEMPDEDPSLGIQAGRRGRGPSKSHCSNRNAVMARVNRERKKMYVQSIEQKLKTLDQENKILKGRILEQDQRVEKLNEEVAYMRNVLKNQTMVSSLLKALNESLGKMHGNDPTITASTNNPDKSVDVQNWIASGQANQHKTSMAVPPLESPYFDSSEVKDDRKRSLFAQHTTSPAKIARKSMPLTQNFKSENPSSVESNLDEEDDKMSHQPKSSPETGSYCEYSRDQSSSRHDSQPPTTPMSQNISESQDKYEASLCETNYSQLSPNFMFNFDDSIFQVDENSPNLFNHETFFDPFEKEPENIINETIDPLKISREPNAFVGKSLFNCPENTGVCLHINSTRVSLEYCSICHSNSLKSQVV